jgi:hypothetical protein
MIPKNSTKSFAIVELIVVKHVTYSGHCRRFVWNEIDESHANTFSPLAAVLLF